MLDLKEALKKEVLYKDEKEKTCVEKEETNPHDAVSDFLLRVMPKKDIEKLNYALGFNPEREIHKELIPNKEKKKLKESVLFEDETGENEPVVDVADVETTEDDESDFSSDNDSEEEPVQDIEDIASDEEDGEDEEIEDEEKEEDFYEGQGKNAFSRIVEGGDIEELLSVIIKALNCHNITAARDSFYSWFDQYDDKHQGEKEDIEVKNVDDNNENSESAEADELSSSDNDSEEEPVQDIEDTASDEEDGEIDPNDLF